MGSLIQKQERHPPELILRASLARAIRAVSALEKKYVITRRLEVDFPGATRKDHEEWLKWLQNLSVNLPRALERADELIEYAGLGGRSATSARNHGERAAKLTAAQVLEIRSLASAREGGPSQAALAQMFGVSQATISNIRNPKRASYKWVEGSDISDDGSDDSVEGSDISDEDLEGELIETPPEG